MRALLACGLSGLLLTGCAGDVTLKRYEKLVTAESAQITARKTPPGLFMSSSPASAGSDPLMVKGMPERTGAAYVEALGRYEKDSDSLRKALAQGIKKEGGGPVDKTKLDRVFTIGLDKPDFEPGDRFARTSIEIVPAGPFIFTGYEAAATEYKSINIGTMSVSNQTGYKLEVDPKLTGSLVGAGIASITGQKTETANKTATDTTMFNPIVAPTKISIVRTGSETTELRGLTFLKLSVQMTGTDNVGYLAVKSTVVDKGVPLSPEKASLKWDRVVLPPRQNLYVCARVSFNMRLISAGAEYYDEGRQEVFYSKGETPWTLYEIVPSQDLDIPMWVIWTPNGALAVNTGVRYETITFQDFDAAVEFKDWLVLQRTGVIGTQALSEAWVEGDDGKDIGTPLTHFSGLSVVRLSQTPPLTVDPAVCKNGDPGSPGWTPTLPKPAAKPPAS